MLDVVFVMFLLVYVLSILVYTDTIMMHKNKNLKKYRFSFYI